MSLQPSFAHWYRGASLAAASASATSPLRGYRGSLAAPVFRTASTIDGPTSGGLGAGGGASFALLARAEAAGGLAASGAPSTSVDQAAESAGGLAAGGASPTSSAFGAGGGVVLAAGGSAASSIVTAVGSFGRWYRGAPLSDSLGKGSSAFGHPYRGFLAWPASPPKGGAVTASEAASGGLRLGGAAPAGVLAVAASPAGGARLGGSSTIGVGLGCPAAGGARFGGSASAASAAPPAASGGVAAGGSGVVRLDASESGAAFALAVGGAAVAGTAVDLAGAGGLSPGGVASAARSIAVDAVGGLALGGAAVQPRVGYRIYRNDGAGGPVDYGDAIAVVFETSWTSGPLPPGSSFRFAVRAFDPQAGLVDENLDASAALIIDAEGRDATRVPPAPIGLRAIPLAGGRARIEWTTADAPASRRPDRFHVYLQPQQVTSYAAPTAVATASSARGGGFAVEVGGLADGVRYAVVVRAANASGEEANVRAVSFTADSAPPTRVDLLIASPSPSVD